MNCKKCMAELEENQSVCPSCGWDAQTQEEQSEPAEKPKKKINIKKLVLAIVAGVLVLALLATILYFALRKNNVYYKSDYTASDFWVNMNKNNVVATIGDTTLTNRQLQVIYWMEVYNFLSYYGDYIAYFGLDTSMPFDQQVYNPTTGMTWEQYFLEEALYTWQQFQPIWNDAQKNNFQLPEEYQEKMDKLRPSMEETAQEGGYDTIDGPLQNDLGTTVVFQDYYEYLDFFYTCNLYFKELADKIEVTEADIEAYFQKHEEELKAMEEPVTKTSGKLVDVQHILVMPQGGTKQGTATVYSEEEWEACRVKAQAIYDEWLAGEMTSESFGALANEKSEDRGGNVTNGGIYTYVAKGDMVEEFDAWCFDDARKPGDHGLVKTVYGYHIMYYVEGEEGWIRYCKEGAETEMADAIIERYVEENPMQVNYWAICLSEPGMSKK